MVVLDSTTSMITDFFHKPINIGRHGEAVCNCDVTVGGKRHTISPGVPINRNENSTNSIIDDNDDCAEKKKVVVKVVAVSAGPE